MATGAENGAQLIFALSQPVVRWGITELRRHPIHSFFAAYLVIRQQAAAQHTDTVELSWNHLDTYLSVPGGPPGKPWFRPFWDQARNAGQDWMRRHPAGSYNPSSVRPGTPGAKVLEIQGKTYVLPEDHYERAREHLLHGERVPLLALCSFLYRDFGFTTDGTSPGPSDLATVFRYDFGYRPDAHDVEFEYLYDDGIPERTDWFVAWTPTDANGG